MRTLITGAAVALSMLAATAAWADAAGDINYRQKVMKAIGGHMGAAASIIKGEGGAAGDLKGHAHALAELAKVTQHIFPTGSGQSAGKTAAKDEIWKDAAAFAKVQNGFVTLAAAFAKAADGGDMGAAGKALGALGKGGCGACHKPYREKK